jgi:hypothetical protein
MSKHSALRLCQRSLEIKHANDVCFAEVKCGPSFGSGCTPRIDFIACAKSWSKLCITGYEIKVDRQDFLRDSKWGNYLEYCHRFYFACPKGLIRPEETPDPAGLVWCSEKGARVVKSTAHKPVDVSWELLYYLILWRSDTKDYNDPARAKEQRAARLEGWLEKKERFSNLAWMVNERIAEKIKDLGEREDSLQRREASAANVIEREQQILSLCAELGEDTWGGFDMAIRRLKKLAASKKASFTVDRVRQLHSELGAVLDSFGQIDAAEDCGDDLLAEDVLRHTRR